MGFLSNNNSNNSWTQNDMDEMPTMAQMDYLEGLIDTLPDTGDQRDQINEILFEISVDTYPRKERGRYRPNFVAKCSRQRSKVVRIPSDYYVGCRQESDGSFTILAVAAPEWLTRSSQEVVRQAAAKRFTNLAAQLLR